MMRMRIVRGILFATLVLAGACAKTKPRVIFVGLDGADWQLLDRYVEDGTMPELGKILERSERRVLLSQHPPLSPLVWTTMMTGVSPLKHRILDFTRFNPQTRQQEPITSDERAVPAIWNMAVSQGKRTGVFGLWATYPAEEGVVLTDRDLPRDYIATTELVRARSLHWIDANEPDLAIVYFQGTDEIGHFTSGDIEAARGYFRRIDSILGEFRQRAEKLDAKLIIASDHGFDWGGAHAESSTATATAAKWHRREGIWIEWPSPKRQGAEMRVDQVCDALLHELQIARTSNYIPRKAVAATQNDEQLAKLKSLGYIASTAPAPRNATGTRTPQSFNNEGLILKEEKRIDSAQHAFEEALRIDPQYASARQNLDDLLSARGVERLKANDCAGALSDLRAVQRDSAMRWTGIAAAEGCLGHESAAREAFEKAAKLDPDLARRLR
jgi:tetratricopeptide (TPR) repeat protein